METIYSDEELSDAPGTPRTPNTPKTPKSPLWTLTRTLSIDPSYRSSGSWYSGTSTLLTPSSHEEDPPASYGPSLFTFPFTIKIVQWIVCIICTGLHSEANVLINNFRHTLFPYITFWTYMIVTGVILISYLLGHKMRETLIHIFNIIAGVLFLVTAIIMLVDAVSVRKTMCVTSCHRLHVMLASEVALCFVNSGLYIADTAYSLYRSYHSITLKH